MAKKNDNVKTPWAEPDGVAYPKAKPSKAQKKANDEFNEVAGLTKKKPAPKKAAKKI